MAHSTEVVEYKKLSNGQFSVKIRCCGNASTDWTHTMAADVAADSVKRATSIDAARVNASNLHEKAMLAENALLDEMGKVVVHP